MCSAEVGPVGPMLFLANLQQKQVGNFPGNQTPKRKMSRVEKHVFGGCNMLQ